PTRRSSDLRVAEQIEKPLAARLQAYPLAYRAMIEKQAGIEVIEQVHLEAQSALLHHEELAALVHAPVLRPALGTPTRLDRDAVARNAQRFRRATHEILQAPPRHVVGNLARWSIFLDVQPEPPRLRVDPVLRHLGVHIDRSRKLRDVRVVRPPASDPFPLEPSSQVPRVLGNAIGNRLRALRHRPRRMRSRALPHEPLEQEQRAFERAVEQRVATIGTQSQCVAEFVVADQEHATPFGKRLAQPIAERAIQAEQRLALPETL